MKSFLLLTKNNKKACANLKSKKTMELVQIYLSKFFKFPDPDPHIECVSGSETRWENEYGSMWIRIHSPANQTGEWYRTRCGGGGRSLELV